MIKDSDTLISAFLTISFFLSIFSSAKSWKNHDYYARVLGDAKRQQEIRHQSEIFRFMTFTMLFLFSVFIVIVCRQFITNNILKASTYLGTALLTTTTIFILKSVGKIEFKPLVKNKNYSLPRIITAFFILLSLSLFGATLYIILTDTEVSFKSIIENYTK